MVHWTWVLPKFIELHITTKVIRPLDITKAGAESEKTPKNWKKTNHKVVSVLKMSDYNRKLFQKKSKLLGGVVIWSSINFGKTQVQWTT